MSMARLWRDQGKAATSSRTARSGLRVVYGRLRHARSEAGEGVARRAARLTTNFETASQSVAQAAAVMRALALLMVLWLASPAWAADIKTLPPSNMIIGSRNLRAIQASCLRGPLSPIHLSRRLCDLPGDYPVDLHERDLADKLVHASSARKQRRSVGTLRTANSSAMALFRSISTLRTVKSGLPTASSASTGSSERQGPHHRAQKSTSTNPPCSIVALQETRNPRRADSASQHLLSSCHAAAT